MPCSLAKSHTLRYNCFQLFCQKHMLSSVSSQHIAFIVIPPSIREHLQCDATGRFVRMVGTDERLCRTAHVGMSHRSLRTDRGRKLNRLESFLILPGSIENAFVCNKSHQCVSIKCFNRNIDQLRHLVSLVFQIFQNPVGLIAHCDAILVRHRVTGNNNVI